MRTNKEAQMEEIRSCYHLGKRAVELLESSVSLMFRLATGCPWATIAEAERYTRVGHGVIADAIRKGEIKSYKRRGGKTALVYFRDLDEWIMTDWTCSVDYLEKDRVPDVR